MHYTINTSVENPLHAWPLLYLAIKLVKDINFIIGLLQKFYSDVFLMWKSISNDEDTILDAHGCVKLFPYDVKGDMEAR